MDLAPNNDLIAAFRNGDQKAFTELYELLAPNMTRFAFSIINDMEESKDMVINVFIAAWEINSRFDSFENLKSFMLVSLRNKCFNYFRKKKGAQKYRNEKLLEPHSDDEIHRKVHRKELIKTITDEIEELPNMPRQVMKMILLEDLTPTEIADKLQISTNNVYVYKKRALDLLKAAVSKRRLLLGILPLFLHS